MTSNSVTPPTSMSLGSDALKFPQEAEVAAAAAPEQSMVPNLKEIQSNLLYLSDWAANEVFPPQFTAFPKHASEDERLKASFDTIRDGRFFIGDIYESVSLANNHSDLFKGQEAISFLAAGTAVLNLLNIAIHSDNTAIANVAENAVVQAFDLCIQCATALESVVDAAIEEEALSRAQEVSYSDEQDDDLDDFDPRDGIDDDYHYPEEHHEEDVANWGGASFPTKT